MQNMLISQRKAHMINVIINLTNAFVQFSLVVVAAHFPLLTPHSLASNRTLVQLPQT